MKKTPNIPLVLTITTSIENPISEIIDFSDQLDWIELRADLSTPFVSPLELDELVAHIPSIYVLRSQYQGGDFSGSQRERLALFSQAVACFDLIELEGEYDLLPEILEVVPEEKRLISWYGGPSSIETLTARLQKYQKIPARFYKLIPEANKAGEELIPLHFLKQINNPKLICFASGPIGLWAQIIAAHYGSALLYAKSAKLTAQVFFSIRQLVEDYGLPTLYPFEKIYGIAGNPVFSSLSPKLHNNTYRYLNHPGIYLPFHIESFNDFWEMVQGVNQDQDTILKFGGFTVVSPFKEEGFKVAEVINNPILEKVKACNVLFHEDGVWHADSTDAFGIINALEKLEIKTTDFKVAVIGCGGAGKTMAVALKALGADVLLVNRTKARADIASNQLGLPFQLLVDFSPKGFDIIINATPVGKRGKEMIIKPAELDKSAVIIDMAYGKDTTPVIQESRFLGRRTLSGKEILVIQVKQQFAFLTGLEMPSILANTLAGFNSKLKTSKTIEK